MSIFESVFKLSNEILENYNDVTVDYDYINGEGKNLILSTPKPITKFQPNEKEIHKLIIKELTLDAVNYCYWYGTHDFRFNGAGATKALTLLDEAFVDYCRDDPACDDYSTCLDKFKQLLIDNRFTMLEDRFRHLDELCIDGESFVDAIFLFLKDEVTFDFIVENMLWYFPGYAGDLFLKRASLFFMNLYREAGLFEKQQTQLPVPADYQVPKILHGFKFIKYSDELLNMIKNEVLIPKSSKYEIQIRAATVLACSKLSEVTGWAPSEIDILFWSRRKEISFPFHLCITTDY
jgi:hypothetical protein